MQVVERSYLPDQAVIRRRLSAPLDVARNADAIRWSERDARMWDVVVPQMAGWLADEEADQLRFDFAQEMQRRKAAA